VAARFAAAAIGRRVSRYLSILFMDVMQLAVVVIVALVVAAVVEVRAARVDPAAALDR